MSKRLTFRLIECPWTESERYRVQQSGGEGWFDVAAFTAEADAHRYMTLYALGPRVIASMDAPVSRVSQWD